MHWCCIFWPAFGCYTPQKLVEICFSSFSNVFARFWCKNDKKWCENEHLFSLFPNAGWHKNAGPVTLGDVIDPNKGVLKCYFKPHVLSVYFFKDDTASVKMDNKSQITKKHEKSIFDQCLECPNAGQNIQHLELFFVTIKNVATFCSN